MPPIARDAAPKTVPFGDGVNRTDAMSDRAPREHGTSLALTCAALLVIPLAAFVATYASESIALKLVSLTSIAGGLWTFLTHGRSRITAGGVYMLAAGLLNGYGGWYWSDHNSINADRGSILLAALAVYGASTLTYVLFLQKSPGANSSLRGTRQVPPSAIRGLRNGSAVLFLVGAGAHEAGIAIGLLAESAAYVGVLGFAGSILLAGRGRSAVSLIRLSIAAGAFALYYTLIFSGGGRLILAGLVIGIGIMWQHRVGTRIKPIAVLAIIPVLIVFAIIGQVRVAKQAQGTAVVAPASGLGSIVSPLEMFGDLLEHNVTSGHGQTFTAEALVLVPRAVWPEKPVQLGRVLAEKLQPDVAAAAPSQSTLAMNEGEFYYNFSWAGILLMILAIGYVLRRLDTVLLRCSLRDSSTTWDLYVLLTISMLAGSTTDLAWGGTPTWTNRNLIRMLVIAPFAAAAYLGAVRSRKHMHQAKSLHTARPAVRPQYADIARVEQFRAVRRPAAFATQYSKDIAWTLPPYDTSVAVEAVEDQGVALYLNPLDVAEAADTAIAQSSGKSRRAAGAILDESLSSIQNFLIAYAALRYLSVRELGVFTTAYTSAQMARFLFRSWLLTPLSIRFATASERLELVAARQAVAATILVGGSACGLLAAISMTVNEYRTTISAFGLALFTLIVQDAWRVHFFTQRRAWLAVANDGASVIITAMFLGACIRGWGHPTVALLLMVWALGTGVCAIIGMVQARALPMMSRATIWIRAQWSLGWALAVSDGIERVASQIALPLVALVAGATALGEIGASRTLMSPYTTLVIATLTFAVPEATRAHAGGLYRLDRFVLAISGAMTSALALFGVALYAMPDWVARNLVGGNWKAAQTLLLAVLLWTGALAARLGALVGLQVLERRRELVRLSTVTAAVLLFAVCGGAAAGGARGAAWAFSVVYLGSAAAYWLAYRRARVAARADSRV